MTALIEAFCPDCAQLGVFEQPPCVDGHGADCPEWFCLTCGTALLIDMPVIDMPIIDMPIIDMPIIDMPIIDMTVEQPRGTFRVRAA